MVFSSAVETRLGLRTRVVDMDPISVARCRDSGVEAMEDDALRPPIMGS